MLLEHDEDDIRTMAEMRAKRLARLIELEAPDFIIANELLMTMEAIEAIFRKHDFDPFEDERVFHD
jgi:DNA-directed RNA polymerase beta' subunit